MFRTGCGRGFEVPGERQVQTRRGALLADAYRRMAAVSALA
jgi:hypothetical protein